jgi:hypothetical protein
MHSTPLPRLKDVREQFPLLELAETLGIAEQLGIVHPADPTSHEPCVVTTDFLLTFHDGFREVEFAVAVKPSADLASRRTLEKLEIERVYWSARNIAWRILTERELPRGLVKNMRWLLPHFDLAESGEFTVDLMARIRTVIEPAVSEGKRSLVEIATACDDRLGLKPGSTLGVIRHLLAVGTLPVDLTVEIDPQRPLCLVQNGGTHGFVRMFAT